MTKLSKSESLDSHQRSSSTFWSPPSTKNWCSNLKISSKMRSSRKTRINHQTRKTCRNRELLARIQLWLDPAGMSRNDKKWSRMRGHMCTCAGSTCGVALYGSRIKKSSCSGQISCCKSSASWNKGTQACPTQTSSTWSLTLVRGTACLKWPSECMSRCVPVAFCHRMPFLGASSITRRKNWSRIGAKMARQLWVGLVR